uniref:Glycosyl transferase family 1 domain-containing protein n=1 Tax=viral metagenome TaxID=1070528 RepID=A0A6C0B031_9ZZZZ
MFYTVQERNDGFGAQFQTMICCILIAENSGNEYIHTPIKSMEHNYDNDPEFISKVENFMNLKNNYEYINTETNLSEIKILDVWYIINNFEANINTYLNSDSLKKIKNCFWKNKNRNFFKNNKLNIAVHIRRPNTHDNGGCGERGTTPLKYYFDIIEKIKQNYSNRELLFHIYSQNDINEYDVFDKKNVIFHLNESLFDTFTGLVAADMLITSRSSLGYSAAILSDGEIYYQPFQHIPGEKWIVCNN